MRSAMFEDTASTEVDDGLLLSIPVKETKKRKTPVKETRSRLWTGVVNNPEKDPDWDLSNARITWAMWQKEVGKQGTEHWQYVCRFANECGWSNAKKNLVKVFDKDHHVEDVNCLDDCIHYTSKPCEDEDCKKKGCKEVRNGDSKVISETFEMGLRPQQGKRRDLEGKTTNDIFTEAFKMVEEGDRKGALDYIRIKRPRDFWCNFERYKKLVNSYAPPEIEKLYDIEDFTLPPIPEKILKKRAILLWGDTNNGKTNYALAHFKAPLKVKTVDNLKKLHPVHDGLVFDETKFKAWDPEDVITLLDMDYTQTIGARFHDTDIPRNMPRIFCHNTDNPFYGPNCPKVHADAIERRIHRIHITEDIRKPESVAKNETQ